MAYVPSTEEYQKGLQGDGTGPDTSPTLGGGASPAAGGGAMGSAPQRAAPSAPAPQQAAPVRPGLQNQRYGTLEERLFDPLSGGIQRHRTGVEEARRGFYEAAGPERTYESTGAESALRHAIYGGGDLENARGLVGARYEGPAGLEQQKEANLQALTQNLRQRTGALESGGGGLQTVLRGSVAGLTPGQARFEARRLVRDPGYKEQVASYRPQVSEAASLLERTRRGAQEYAGLRGQQEADIAARSRQFLGGERSGLQEQLDRQVEEARAQQQAAQEAYRRFTDTGGIKGLGELSEFDPELQFGGFNTEAQKARGAAQQAYDDIINRQEYSAIGDIPLAGVGINKRGRETYTVQLENPKTGELETMLLPTAVDRGLISKQEKDLFLKRQGELEKSFGGQHSRRFRERYLRGGGATRDFREEGIAGLRTQGSKDYLSMVELPELWQYIDFDPGVSPARGNVASEDQKEAYNRIQDLMGEVSRLDSTEPFRAAKIAGDLERYLEDEMAVLESNKEALSAGQKEWMRQVKKAREKFMDMKDKEAWGTVSRVVGGIATGGLTEQARSIAGEDAGRLIGSLTTGGWTEAAPAMFKGDVGGSMLTTATSGLHTALTPSERVRGAGYLPQEVYQERKPRDEVVEGDMVVRRR